MLVAAGFKLAKRLSPVAVRLMRRLRALYEGLWLLPFIRRIPAPWRKWVGLGLLGLAHFSHEGLWVVPFVPLTLELKVGLGVFLYLLGEVAWWLGVLILGKELLAQYQQVLVQWLESIVGQTRLARARHFFSRLFNPRRYPGQGEAQRNTQADEGYQKRLRSETQTMNNATQSEPPPAELPLNERLAQAAEAVAQRELGLLPRRVRVAIDIDTLIIWLDGALTLAETELADEVESREYVRRYNQQLAAAARTEIIQAMESVLRRSVTDFESHVDASRGHVLWYFALGSIEEK
ncbi:MAG: Na-translocating system protein MpsC family protein [Anaerolineales bacterium]